MLASPCLAPGVALGNTGTPLMWATFTHLLVGNAVIGVVEGLLVARLLRSPRRRAVPVMIVANNCSAWAGFLLFERFSRSWHPTIEHLGLKLVALAVAAWAITVPLEWPFVLAAVRRAEWRPLRALAVSAVVQSVTYVPLFLWYSLASSISLLTGAAVVSPDAIPAAGAVDVYFIGAVDGDVWKVTLGARTPEKLCLLGSSNRDDRLFFEATSPRHWVLRGHVGDGGQAQAGVGLVAGVEGRAATRRDGSAEPEPGTWSSFGAPVDLRDPASALRSFWTGFWPVEGLVVSDPTGRDRMRLSLETPFVAWATRNVTVLPGALALAGK